MHKNHRERVRNEFFANYAEGWAEHRILEMLLFYVDARKDVNPLAHELIAAFQTIRGVLNATPEQLRSIVGVGDVTVTLLRLIPAIMERYHKNRTELGPIVHTTKDVSELLKSKFQAVKEETVFLFLVDGKGKLLDVREISSEAFSQTPSFNWNVTQEVITLRASGVYLVHHCANTPREESALGWLSDHVDDLENYLANFGVILLDYLIFSRKELVCEKNKIRKRQEILERDAVPNWLSIPKERPKEQERSKEAMRKEFLTSGAKNWTEQSLLQLLLFHSLPKGRTQTAAARLLGQFGSLAGVLDATPDELEKVDGIDTKTSALLKLMPVIMRRYEEVYPQKQRFVYTVEDAKQILKPYFVGATVEKIYMLCVDNKRRYLGVRKISEGSIQAADINLRSVIEGIMGLSAAGIYLAHNHTSMLAVPSQQDWLSTDAMRGYLANIGVTLYDHLIFVDDDMVSLKESEYGGNRPVLYPYL